MSAAEDDDVDWVAHGSKSSADKSFVPPAPPGGPGSPVEIVFSFDTTGEGRTASWGRGLS